MTGSVPQNAACTAQAAKPDVFQTTVSQSGLTIMARFWCLTLAAGLTPEAPHPRVEHRLRAAKNAENSRSAMRGCFATILTVAAKAARSSWKHKVCFILRGLFLKFYKDLLA